MTKRAVCYQNQVPTDDHLQIGSSPCSRPLVLCNGVGLLLPSVKRPSKRLMAAYDFGPIHTHLPHLQPFRDHTAAPVAHVATAMMMPLHLLDTAGSNMHCLPHSHRINSKLHRTSARYLLAHTSHCKTLLEQYISVKFTATANNC